MEIGNDIVIQCPDCRFTLVRHTWASCNTIGAQPWTDGKQTGPYLVNEPLIAWCRSCRAWFLLTEANRIFEAPPRQDWGELPVVAADDENSSDDYRQALATLRCGKAEKTLRIRLWQKDNDERRHKAEEASPLLTPALTENMESLLSLPESALPPVVRAELYRELGDFTRALRSLEKEDPEGHPLGSSEPGLTIRLAAEARQVLPVVVGTRQPRRPSREGPASLSAMIDAGTVPFPNLEDVFAFPAAAKEEAQPILLVNLEKIRTDWSGWITFCYGSRHWRRFHDRLFTPEEWEAFEALPSGSKRDLIRFWEQRSWAPGSTPEEISHYYRTLYRIRNYCPEEPWRPVPPLRDVEDFRASFAPVWHYYADKLKAVSEDGRREEFQQNETAIYWDLFWESFRYDTAYILDETLLEERCADRRQREDAQSKRRTEAFEGIAYIELGGVPGWFQGCDKTPLTPKGDPMDFVGQFWTDYLNAYGSMLVYLFFDAESGYATQVYDYD